MNFKWGFLKEYKCLKLGFLRTFLEGLSEPPTWILKDFCWVFVERIIGVLNVDYKGILPEGLSLLLWISNSFCWMDYQSSKRGFEGTFIEMFIRVSKGLILEGLSDSQGWI